MNNQQLKDFIEQTAKEYDVRVDIVEGIYKKYGEIEFYQKLEETIDDEFLPTYNS